jgi:hypothetical protein
VYIWSNIRFSYRDFIEYTAYTYSSGQPFPTQSVQDLEYVPKRQSRKERAKDRDKNKSRRRDKHKRKRQRSSLEDSDRDACDMRAVRKAEVKEEEEDTSADVSGLGLSCSFL